MHLDRDPDRLHREGARADKAIVLMALAALAAYLIVHWRS